MSKQMKLLCATALTCLAVTAGVGAGWAASTF